MRILFLTPRIPYPPYRGDKLKIYNLIRQLAGKHEIFLLSFIEDSSERRWMSSLQPLCRRIELIRLPLWRSIGNCLGGIWRNEPFQVMYFASWKMKKALETMVREEKPDLIHTHLIRMAPYTAGLNIPRVLDLTDAVSLYLSRFRDAERNHLKRWLLNIELERMIRFEPILDQFERILVCSEIDKRVLQENAPHARIEILLNGIDTDLFAAAPDVAYEAGRIIFTGNMSYYPNADGAEFFVKRVFPLVQRHIPGAKVFLVGQNPPAAVKRLASESVVVTGFVPDIRTEYMKSRVAVSPIRFGAGTLNKVLEPLALGVPVVATSVSVEGLLPAYQGGILVADDAEGFASHVVKVLSDDRVRAAMARASTERVRRDHGWPAVAASLEKVYSGILRTGS